MKATHLLYAAIAMILWAACNKDNNDDIVPIVAPVDTFALLTGNVWRPIANAEDINMDGEIDIGSIKPMSGDESYTYFKNGVFADTFYYGGVPYSYITRTWKFSDTKSVVSLFVNDTSLTDAFRIMKISDSNLVTLQIGNPQFGWRIYTKYVH